MITFYMSPEEENKWINYYIVRSPTIRKRDWISYDKKVNKVSKWVKPVSQGGKNYTTEDRDEKIQDIRVWSDIIRVIDHVQKSGIVPKKSIVSSVNLIAEGLLVTVSFNLEKGTGNYVRIQWGVDGPGEKIQMSNLTEGTNSYQRTLKDGTHEICVTVV